MSWVLDGSRIKAKYLGDGAYLGNTIIEGVVTHSRVKYGGEVQYTVKLDKPVQFRWRSLPTDTVLINRSEILE